MATFNVIHYTLKNDYLHRDGSWVRHLSATYGGVERRVTTRMGSLWNNVLQRTKKGSKYQDNKPSYLGVINKFSSFEDFCDFCLSCPGFGEIDEDGNSFALDKDIIGDGKTYSKESCCFVPKAINNLLLEKGPTKNSTLPPGITIRGERYRVRDGSGGKQYMTCSLEEAIFKKKSLKKDRIRRAIDLVAYDIRITQALTKKYLEKN